VWAFASGSAQCGFGPRRRRVDHIVVFCVCMPLVVRPKVASSLCFRFCCFVQVRRPNHGTAHPHRCVVVCVFVHVFVCLCVYVCASSCYASHVLATLQDSAPSGLKPPFQNLVAASGPRHSHGKTHSLTCVCLCVSLCVSVCLFVCASDCCSLSWACASGHPV
jgi:hypothetical protein